MGKKIILKKYEKATTAFQKFLGLMFRFKVKKPIVFFFKEEQLIPLHMLFVFMPIDVIFLNAKREVVELKQGFLPFTFYNPRRKAKYLIELANGAIKRQRINIGDKIGF